ncbi:MAG TPA: POTRA domain-containing protein, partial [Nitrospiria bacterium]|nr:POTRA domain-containing protein [Nitrospiria bacterium]
LLGFLHGEGYLLAKVRTTMSEIPGTNQVRMTLMVNEGRRTRIGKITFTGNPGLSNLDLRTTLNLKLKKAVYYHMDHLKADLARLKKRYDRRGYFRAEIGPADFSVNEKSNEVDISIPIEAGVRLKTRFEGLEPFTETDLAPLLLFAEERDYDRSVFEASADRLFKFYQSRGYPFAKVDFERTEIPGENTLLARFRVEPGNFACLRRIIFYGNTFFPTEKLLGLLKTREGNLLFCGTLDPEIIAGDAKAIKTQYLQEGFQGIKVEPHFEYNPDKTQANLIFSVAEGPRTLVAGIEIEGNRAISTDVLMAGLELKAGEPFDTVPARRDLDGILSRYGGMGHLYSEVTTQLTFSDDRTGIVIRYIVEEGPQVVFGSTLLTGNTFTREDVIMRELLFKPGDPYTEEAIQRSRREIQKLGILGNIRLEPVTPIDPGEPETVKDLQLKVQ